MRSLTVSRADSTQIGMSFPNARSAVTTATPSSSGIWTSRTSASCDSLDSSRSASLPCRRDPNVEARMPQSAGDGSSDVRVVVDHQHRSTRALLRGRLSPDPHVDYGYAKVAGAEPQRFFRSTSGWRIPVRSAFVCGF